MTTIAFEGNVYSGKTTLALQVAQSTGFEVVPEYHPTGNSDSETKEQQAWQIQKRYLTQEQRRAEQLSQRSLLDRSIISLAIHTALVYSLYDIDIRQPFTRAVKAMTQKKHILIPYAIIIVSAPYTTLRNRFERNNEKNTPSSLIDERYCSGVERLLTVAADYFSTTTVDTTNATEAAIAATAFIQKTNQEAQQTNDIESAIEAIMRSSIDLRRTLRQ